MADRQGDKVVKSILTRFLAALRRSTWFKKYSMGVGAFLLGMLAQENYWREIRQTLDVWGVSRDEWHTVLWAVVGLSGVGVSVVLSALMTPVDKIVVADKAIKKEQDKGNRE